MKRINIGLTIVNVLLYLLLFIYPIVLACIGIEAAINGSVKGIGNPVSIYGIEAAINEIWLVAGFIYFPVTVIWCFFMFVAILLTIYIVVSSIISAVITSKKKR